MLLMYRVSGAIPVLQRLEKRPRMIGHDPLVDGRATKLPRVDGTMVVVASLYTQPSNLDQCLILGMISITCKHVPTMVVYIISCSNSHACLFIKHRLNQFAAEKERLPWLEKSQIGRSFLDGEKPDIFCDHDYSLTNYQFLNATNDIWYSSHRDYCLGSFDLVDHSDSSHSLTSKFLVLMPA